MKRPILIVLFVLAVLAVMPVHHNVAQSERLQIVASFSILADTVQQIAGDAADVRSLIPIGADPHSFIPSPQDIVAIAEADVVFVNGINFESLLMEAIENAGGDANIVTVSWCVPILASGGSHHEEEEGEEDHEEAHSEVALREESEIDPVVAATCADHVSEMAALHEDHEDDDHETEDMTATEEPMDASSTAEADEHDHNHEHGAEKLGMLYTLECGGHEDHEGSEESEPEGAHAHGGCDPHVWTDPHNVIYWTYMIRDTLSELDPANAEVYAANATAYAATLDALAHDFVIPMLLSVPDEQRILVTNHETLGYMAALGGYEVVATVIPGGGTAAEPSAADIANLIRLVRDEGVTAVFAENTVGTNIAEQVAAESGARFYVLLSDSLSMEGGSGATYTDYLRFNVSTIVEALGGGM